MDAYLFLLFSSAQSWVKFFFSIPLAGVFEVYMAGFGPG